MRFIALLHPEQQGGYTVTFPDFPGCISEGDSMDEAVAMAEDALAGHVECLLEDGMELPAPSRLEDFDVNGAVPMLVAIPDAPARHVRISVTLPEDALKRIDAFAKSHGYTRSGLLLKGARELVERG